MVKDIKAAENFFIEAMGVKNFSKTRISRAKEYEATYYGEPCDAENLVSMAYTGETFIELIQPLSGAVYFHDYLESCSKKEKVEKCSKLCLQFVA